MLIVSGESKDTLALLKASFAYTEIGEEVHFENIVWTPRTGYLGAVNGVPFKATSDGQYRSQSVVIYNHLGNWAFVDTPSAVLVVGDFLASDTRTVQSITSMIYASIDARSVGFDLFGYSTAISTTSGVFMLLRSNGLPNVGFIPIFFSYNLGTRITEFLGLSDVPLLPV